MHIERTTTIRLALVPEAALFYFSPEGERLYVAGWDPEPLHAPDGTLSAAGAVFRTRADGEETVWLVLAFDRAAHRAAYARLTPGSRVGTVEVEIAPDGAGASTVRVSYRLTALSEAGETKLAAMTPEAYAATIGGWQREILAAHAARG